MNKSKYMIPLTIIVVSFLVGYISSTDAFQS